MRCFECGYQNSPDAKICVKCGTKLSSGSAAPQPPANGGMHIPPEHDGGKKTMVGRVSEAPSWDTGNAPPPPPAGAPSPGAASASVQRCDKCGYYPLRQAVSVNAPCPNCGFTGSPAGVQGASGPAAGAGAGNAANPGMGSAADQGTGVHVGSATPPPTPKSKPSDAKTRRLSDFQVGDTSSDEPIIVLTDEKTGRKVAFSGVQLSLNRSDLDPANETISSKEHLTISVFDGNLIVQDKSSNGATFVQAKERTQVAPGSRIIIGNKVYTIEINEP
ncbi:MAG: hypothetical protein HLUCCA01_10720 [Bacteroidetes bacterium HLUCCA01]|nr:MAG: hypothetical protein HLUCCA01_10720 [Bacteroidetes bacterium HLUCCA01]